MLTKSADNRFIEFLAELTAFCNHFTNICIHSKRLFDVLVERLGEKDLQLMLCHLRLQSRVYSSKEQKKGYSYY